MEFVLNKEREFFQLTHHELRLARLKRDAQMKARATEQEENLELTFEPKINDDYNIKSKANFLERLKEYEENRKLKMAKLHKEEWKRLQKKTAQTTAVSPRSNYLLNKSNVTAKSGVFKGTSSSNSKRLTENNEVLEKPTDWKTGEKLFHPKINDNSKKILSNDSKFNNVN